MARVDCFVFLTDVQYIRRGWINRNRIARPGHDQPMYFTVPVKRASHTEKICRLQIANVDWVEKHLRTFLHVYGKRIVRSKVFEFYRDLNRWEHLCPMVCASLRWMADFLALDTQFADSSRFASSLKGEQRIIDLCKQLGAATYVSLPGGKTLYHEDVFAGAGLKLEFIAERPDKLSILHTCFADTRLDLRL